MKSITVFLDDRNIFIDTLKKYQYEQELSKAGIDFKYLNKFEEKIINDYNIIIVFLDTCWNDMGGEEMLFKQIDSIKDAAKLYSEKNFLIFPYSTTFRDDIEFNNLYEHLESGKTDNIVINIEPFLIRINSSYQMNGIISMIKNKIKEMGAII